MHIGVTEQISITNGRPRSSLPIRASRRSEVRRRSREDSVAATAPAAKRAPRRVFRLRVCSEGSAFLAMLPKLRLQHDSSAAGFAHHAPATGNLTMPWQGVADILLANRPAEKQRLFMLSSRKIYPDCRTVVICNGECPVDLISQPPKNLRT
jgi:hypothetical protein